MLRFPSGAAFRAVEIGGHIFRRLGFDSWFSEEPQIPEPVDEAIGPRAVRDEATISQTASGWRFAWSDLVPRMMAPGVYMHFNIWHSVVEHRGEVLGGPYCVDPIAPTGGSDERGRRIARNDRRSAPGKQGRTRINDSCEVWS